MVSSSSCLLALREGMALLWVYDVLALPEGAALLWVYDLVAWLWVYEMLALPEGMALMWVYDLLELPEGAAEFLVVHSGAVFLGAPHMRHLVGFDDAEDALGAVLPLDQLRVVGRVVQQVEQELPQVVTLRYCNHRKQ